MLKHDLGMCEIAENYEYGVDGSVPYLRCDYCGIVEDVGHEVTVPLEKGDWIKGFIHRGVCDIQHT
jgi:hypothetical protein